MYDSFASMLLAFLPTTPFRSPTDDLVGCPAETGGREQHDGQKPKFKGLASFFSSPSPSPAPPPHLPPSQTSCIPGPSTPSQIPNPYLSQSPHLITISSVINSCPTPSRSIRSCHSRINVLESEFCPHVPAQLHLSHWTSLASLDHQAEMESCLSPEVIEKLNSALFAAYYGVGLAQRGHFREGLSPSL